MDYEGGFNYGNRRLNIPMQVDQDYSDIFELTSVTVYSWEHHIDENISSAFVVNDEEDDCAEDLDGQFSKALNIRAEVSKVQASIGSTKVDEEPCPLFQGPHVTTMNNLEKSLSDVISPDMMSKVISEISAAAANNP